jgi:signal transduction histidine kinase
METIDRPAAPRRAIEHLLQTARRHLGMPAAFAAELTAEEQVYCAASGAESFTIVEGGSLPRLDGYCHHVFTSDAPWVVRDTAIEARTSSLDITSTGRLRAYLGVPLRLPDGTRFGTLCCIDHDPRPDLDDRHVAVLTALADLAGFQLSLLADTTERLRTLELLGGQLAGRVRTQERSLAALTRLIDASRVPLLVVEPSELEVGYVNPAGAELLGVGVAELTGARLRTRLPADEDAALRRSLAGDGDGADGPHHLELHPGDPHARVVEVSVQRVADVPGGPLVLVAGYDVTPQRRAADQLRVALDRERDAVTELRRLERIRSAFLAAVSHELRTPLTSLQLAAQTLAAGRAAPQQVPELHQRLVVNARRLDRLLVDLLDLNRAERGRLGLVRERVRLDALVRDAADHLDTGSHRIDLDLAPVQAWVAPIKFERIVVNLLDNAVVHTSPGTIEVRLVAEDTTVLLVVEDHGGGIDPADRDRLFAPFEQGDTAPAHRPGTGIGLSLVATFVELHGGEVWIEEPRGGGTAVHVRLPVDGGTG